MVSTSIIDGTFDFIVVGGGSAGCIMASRLSETPSNRVLLIEAGQDYPPGGEPDDTRDPAAPAFFNFKYFMPLMGEGATPREGGVGVPVPLAQGSVIGGGGTVNGMHAQRGEDSDYDEWRQLGVTGWSWEDVLPFFNKVENDLDFQGPDHGGAGLIKIKRQGPEKWSKLSLAFATVLESKGIPKIKDLNGTKGPGYGPVPLNATDHRISSAVAYLNAEVRARPNLAILANTKVRRVLFAGKRVRGVELLNEGSATINAANVIVSCGSFLSPQILLRSGLGPARALEEAGIAVVADRPGVGQNFQNHALVNIFAHIPRAARQTRQARAACLMVARLSSNVPSCPPADLIFNLWERTPGSTVNNPLARQMADFMLILNKAYSVGEIKLDPSNPDGPPKARTNLLSDQRDLDRMVAGFKFIAELTLVDQMSGLINDVFALKPSPFGMMILQQDWKARTISALGGMALGGPSNVRRFLLKNAIIPIVDIISDPARLEAHVRETAGPTHSGGTCSLGNPDAPNTVVDEHCRVVGVEGLRVVDASIFPRLMRAGTNLPTMMAAEKAATSISQGH